MQEEIDKYGRLPWSGKTALKKKKQINNHKQNLIAIKYIKIGN